MTGCRGKNEGGGPCGAPLKKGRDWCWFHDPDSKDERKEARRRGVKAQRAGREPGGGPPVPMVESEMAPLGTREERLEYAVRMCHAIAGDRSQPGTMAVDRAKALLGWVKFADELAERVGEAASHLINAIVLEKDGGVTRVDDAAVLARMEASGDERG